MSHRRASGMVTSMALGGGVAPTAGASARRRSKTNRLLDLGQVMKAVAELVVRDGELRGERRVGALGPRHPRFDGEGTNMQTAPEVREGGASPPLRRLLEPAAMTVPAAAAVVVGVRFRQSSKKSRTV